MRTFSFPLCLSFALLGALAHQRAIAATERASIPGGDLLWQIGIPDDLSTEFADFHNGPETVQIPAMGTKLDAQACAQISRGVRASSNPTFDISYPLTEVPTNGALFTFKLLSAPISGSQMAVFSNGNFAGLIQLWGTVGRDSPNPWWKTYRLYIPRELIKAGKNQIRFTAPHAFWGDSTNDDEQWWTWDYLKLEALSAPINEPWHGKVSYLGTSIWMGRDDFTVNDDTLRLAPVILKWLGIAYSGNTMRANSFYQETKKQPKRLEYVQLLASYNMTVMADFLSGNYFKNDTDGQIPQRFKGILKSFFQEEGKYVQYYELGNEPCMIGNPDRSGGMAEYLSLAKEIDANKPATMMLAAPGWAYGSGRHEPMGGPPPDWDASAKNRMQVEALCDCINGHSYGYSYNKIQGGSFMGELADFDKIEDGWPKEYVNSEAGTHQFHTEANGAKQASSQPHIQAFDRIMRAHLAVVDRTMQFTTISTDQSMFAKPDSWDKLDLFAAAAAPDGEGKDNRMKVYRRLALAYATHGAPLRFSVVNQSDLQFKMVYFRAVDTSKLAPQVGSGATSDKILLNFVNFENAPETLDVNVTLPTIATYQAERVGAGDTWAAAHSTLSLTGKPNLELKESLGPGESVQYILSAPQ